jgi:hypothetical protein
MSKAMVSWIARLSRGVLGGAGLIVLNMFDQGGL